MRPGRVLVLRARHADAETWGRFCSPPELHRARQVPPERQAGILTGRGATRWYLGQLLGREPPEVPIVRPTFRDRPGLDPTRLPEAWRSLTYNRSLARGTTFIAVGLGTHLGLDVEPWPPETPVDVASLLEAGLPPAEASAVRAAPKVQQPRRALEGWLRYEAYAKATGSGVVLRPDDYERGWTFTAFDPGHRCLGMLATRFVVTTVDVMDLPTPLVDTD